MEDITPMAEQTYKQDCQILNELEEDGSSFCTPCIARPRDYSFSAGPSLIDGQLTQSPAFTCKSSFLHDDGEFSFSSCYKSIAAEFSSPLQLMPSFTFSSPMTTRGQENVSLRFKKQTCHQLTVTSGDTRRKCSCYRIHYLLNIMMEKWGGKKFEEGRLGLKVEAYMADDTIQLDLISFT